MRPFAKVQVRGLVSDTEIREELMRRLRENNYIPPALADEYAACGAGRVQKATKTGHN